MSRHEITRRCPKCGEYLWVSCAEGCDDIYCENCEWNEWDYDAEGKKNVSS